MCLSNMPGSKRPDQASCRDCGQEDCVLTAALYLEACVRVSVCVSSHVLRAREVGANGICRCLSCTKEICLHRACVCRGLDNRGQSFSKSESKWGMEMCNRAGRLEITSKPSMQIIASDLGSNTNCDVSNCVWLIAPKPTDGRGAFDWANLIKKVGLYCLTALITEKK